MAENQLPEVIKIDDITSGKIDPDVIYKEIDRLKYEINVLRHDMSLFIKSLATIPEGFNQQEYYKNVARRLQVLQTTIKDYCAQYNRLLPIINLSQIKLGHEVEVTPQQSTSKSDRNTPKSIFAMKK